MNKLILLFLLIPVFALLNLVIGSVAIPLPDVINILLGRGCDSEVFTNIILHTRLPQTLTAIACGAGLAMAGLEMQTVFHNPLAGPSVLGISSAASLGVAFMVLLGGAFGGRALTHFGLVGNTALTVAAIIGFARVTGGQIYVFVGLMAVLCPLSLLLSKSLNTLLLGERYAANLGLNVRRSRSLIICSAGVLTAICTAYCGPIMFLGLAVPHIARGLFSTADHRTLMPATLLCGASLALICNLIARLPGMEGALPINSVTALIGAPVAIAILLRRS